jgi:8-oxo-dGTP pyrophosphatase MutT (NUDIX family)
MEKEHDIRKKVKFGDKEYYFKEYFDDDFSDLENITQVLGVVLNDNNEILLISEDGKSWSLPGGTIETNEKTYLETLKREVFEEAAVVIDESTFVPFFYMKIFQIEGGNQVFKMSQLRYITRVKEVNIFHKDPGGDVKFRKFVPVGDIEKELSWTSTNSFIKKFLTNYLEKGRVYS